MTTTHHDPVVPAADAPAKVTARMVAEAAERLAAPSPVVAGVLELLDQVGAPVRTIAARVSQSPEIAAQVLRLGNSALFTEPVDTIERAVVRIGERNLRGLLLAASTYGLLEGPLAGYGYPRLYLLRHSGEVAAIAQSIANRTAAALATRAQLAGLLHDLGKPILAVVAADSGVDTRHERLDGVERERAVFGTDHTRVGTWIAKRWGLPEDVSAALEHHHDEQAPEDPVARMVWLADIAVHAAAGEEEATGRLPEAAAACGLAADALEALLIATPDTEGPRRPPGLTDREVEVLRMLARGGVPKTVAHELGCSLSTIHNHLHHIYRKLDVTGQSQALMLAREKGWV